VVKNINDYNSIPVYNDRPCRYKFIVSEIESRIRRISALPDNEETKISLIKGMMRSMLGQLDG